jgi:hypothetical protein
VVLVCVIILRNRQILNKRMRGMVVTWLPKREREREREREQVRLRGGGESEITSVVGIYSECSL